MYQKMIVIFALFATVLVANNEYKNSGNAYVNVGKNSDGSGKVKIKNDVIKKVDKIEYYTVKKPKVVWQDVVKYRKVIKYKYCN
jgi:hypothetical protein